VDPKNPNLKHFNLDLSNEEIRIYSAVIYCYAFKKDIKLAIAVFIKDGKEVAQKLYFSTNLKQEGEKIVSYYRARFQIEFIYRDVKQYTGLTTCQAKPKQTRFSF